MKRMILTLTAVCAMSSGALADPARLSDAQLDGVTAGSLNFHLRDKGRFSNVNFTNQNAVATSFAVALCNDCVVNGGSLTISAVAISSASNSNFTLQSIH